METADLSHHISRRFNEDMERVRTRVLAMGGLVEDVLGKAITSVVEGDSSLGESLAADDLKVNAMEVAIDEECSRILATRSPAASDLRLIVAIIKTITDLERIGDEASKIARVAQKICESERVYTPRFTEIKHMVGLVREMLRTALDAFARLDLSKTVDLARQDEQVDEQFRAATRQLITFMLEDPRTISMSLEVLFVAKAIERIGDHAKNIAEYVVYMVKGKDVRHTSVQEMERETLQS